MSHPSQNLRSLGSLWLAAALCAQVLPLAARADSLCPKPAAFSAPDGPQTDTDAQDIEIQSDDADVGVDGDAILQGKVRVRQGEREIQADGMRLDLQTRAFQAEGQVAYQDSQVRISGRSGEGSESGGVQFNDTQFELRERGARGAAQVLQLTPQGVLRLEGVSYSTCPLTDQAWKVQASSITLDTEAQLGSGRGARIDFKGVPLVYLPWLTFPLGTERKSGFLFPSFGHSSRSGAQLAVPYYWNIAPNADLTFEPMLLTRRGVDLAGDFRYLGARQRGHLLFHFLPGDDVRGEDRSRFRVNHVMQLPRTFRLTLDADQVSDAEYFEDFAQDREGTSIPFLEQLARLSYRDEHWRLSGEVQHFQTIDRELSDPDRPYARLPRLVASGDFALGSREWLRYGLDSELVYFQRSLGVTGWRLDARPELALDRAAPGYFLRPSLSWRYTGYALSDLDEAPGAGIERSPARSLPVASFDAGLFFERAAGSHSQRRMTLEPRLLYLYTPFRNQDDLPLFDTAAPDLNLVQLFRTNRYLGADRVGDANQVSVGVTTRLLDAASGEQFLTATLGQTWYLDPPRVRLPDESSRSSSGHSDLVAELALTAYKNWNAGLGVQWDPGSTARERMQASLQYRPSAEQVVNLSYRFQRERLEQAEVSTAWPLTERYRAFGRVVYSFQDSDTLERFAGLEYRSCCWRLRVVGRRFVRSRTGEQDTGIYVQLELNGLASVGSAADDFLQAEIRGYSPLDTGPH